jgi:hypothetical protein
LLLTNAGLGMKKAEIVAIQEEVGQNINGEVCVGGGLPQMGLSQTQQLPPSFFRLASSVLLLSAAYERSITLGIHRWNSAPSWR